MSRVRLPGSLIKSTNVDILPAREHLLKASKILRNVPDISSAVLVQGLEGLVPDDIRIITGLVDLGMDGTTDAFLSALPEGNQDLVNHQIVLRSPFRWLGRIKEHLQKIVQPTVEALYEWAPQGYAMSTLVAGVAVALSGDLALGTMSLSAALPIFGGIRPISLESGEMLVRLAETRLDMYDSALTRIRQTLVLMIESGESNWAISDWLEAETALFTGVQRDMEVLRDCLKAKELLSPALGLRFSQMVHDTLGNEFQFLSNSPFMLRGEGADSWRSNLWQIYSSTSPNVVAAAKREIAKLMIFAREHGVTLRADGSVVFAPHVPLETVGGLFKNLLENGIKYSDPAKPDRYVKVHFISEGHTLDVFDNGIGMESAFAERLGTVSQREGRKDTVSGTGTGWMLIAGILETLGWSFRVESTLGEGTRVIMNVPEEDVIPSNQVSIDALQHASPKRLSDLQEREGARRLVEENVALVKGYLDRQIRRVAQRYRAGEDTTTILMDVLRDNADGGRTFEVVKAMGKIVKWHSRKLGGTPYFTAMQARYIGLYNVYRGLTTDPGRLSLIATKDQYYRPSIGQIFEGVKAITSLKGERSGVSLFPFMENGTARFDSEKVIDRSVLEVVLDHLMDGIMDDAKTTVMMVWDDSTGTIRIDYNSAHAPDDIISSVRSQVEDAGWTIHAEGGSTSAASIVLKIM